MNELLGYFEDEAAKLYPSIPLQAEPVPFLKGAGTAIVQGPKHALDVAAAAAAQTFSPMVERTGAEWFGEDFADWIRGETELAMQSVKETRVDPAKMGTAANIIHSVGSVLTMGVMGAPLGVVGAAASIGGLSGYDKYLELRDQGVDEDTALKVAGVTGGTMAVGAGLPAFVGKTLATQIASGIGMNVPLGMVERGASGAILSSNGYEKVAEHYRALDGEAVLVDALLGAAFPVGARALRLTTQQTDAALVADQGIHQQTRNPGLDTSLEQLDVNTKNLVEADIQFFAEGRTFDQLDLPKTGDQVPNPQFDAMVREAQDAIDTHLLTETGMSRQEWEAFAKGEEDAVQVRVAKEMDVRQQARDGEAVAGRDAEGKEAAGARPEAQEEVTPEKFAREEVARMAETNPDMRVVDDEGNIVTAKEMDEKLADTERVAREDSYLYNVAIACARIHGA